MKDLAKCKLDTLALTKYTLDILDEEHTVKVLEDNRENIVTVCTTLVSAWDDRDFGATLDAAKLLFMVGYVAMKEDIDKRPSLLFPV